MILSIFSSPIKNMNFKVMKCYKLVFNFENYKNNIGSILMTCLIFFFFVLMIIYFVKGNKILKNILEKAYKKQFVKKDRNCKTKNEIFENKEKSSIRKTKSILKKNKIEQIISINNDEEKNEKKESEKNIKKDNNNIYIFKRNKSYVKSLNLKISCPPKTEKKIKKGFSINSYSSKNTINNSTRMKNTDTVKDINSKDTLFLSKFKNKYYKNVFSNDLKEGDKDLISNNIRRKDSTKKYQEQQKSKYKNQKKNSLEMEDLIDEELNNLDYKDAIRIDKRSFMEYYWSLLNKKHLILFVFLNMNDYNIKIIKISFFIVSFSSYFTVNGFFFSDETMHKIYEDNGRYNLLYQIPQIIYSYLVSIVINTLLRYFSLSENSILELKKQKRIININIKSEEIEKCLKIKLIIYFIFSYLLLAFFWYFISSFCAVYNNTQIILIKNTLFSFGLSMIFPFGYILLPGLFRIPALKAKNRDRKSMYKLSKYIALLF